MFCIEGRGGHGVAEDGRNNIVVCCCGLVGRGSNIGNIGNWVRWRGTAHGWKGICMMNRGWAGLKLSEGQSGRRRRIGVEDGAGKEEYNIINYS